MSTEPLEYTPYDVSRSHNLAQQRMRNFGVTIIVMVVCFILYYLGFFGGVEGPLEAKQIGAVLAEAGFTKFHLLFIMLGLLVISLAWNWCYNGLAHLAGARRTCLKTVKSKGRMAPCGAAVVRKQSHGGAATQYHCQKGHVTDKAHFNPVKKNMLAHTVWMTLAVCCGILICFM